MPEIFIKCYRRQLELHVVQNVAYFYFRKPLETCVYIRLSKSTTNRGFKNNNNKYLRFPKKPQKT